MNRHQLTGVLLAHVILFSFLCIACAWQSYKCLALYNLKETSVKMIIMKASDKRFPAIAINPGFREDTLGKDLDNTLK